MAGTATAALKGQINVGVYDGTGTAFPDGTKILYYLFDGSNQRKVFDYFPPQQSFAADVQETLADNYTVVVTLDNYGTAGYQPIHIAPKTIQGVRLMLLPDNRKFNFTDAAWSTLKLTKPDVWNILSGTIANPPAGNLNAQGFYENQMANQPKNIACLLNILSAMEQIQLGGVGTPLDFIKDILWNNPQYPMQQDRFYCWVDKGLIDAIIEASNLFASAPVLLHGGTASRSWKEIQFAEANVQFTFHESVANPANPDWILLEPDIDYFKDPGAHLLGEVVVNWLGALTDPAHVYQLRWISGNLPGCIPFDPPYTIVKV